MVLSVINDTSGVNETKRWAGRKTPYHFSPADSS